MPPPPGRRHHTPPPLAPPPRIHIHPSPLPPHDHTTPTLHNLTSINRSNPQTTCHPATLPHANTKQARRLDPRAVHPVAPRLAALPPALQRAAPRVHPQEVRFYNDTLLLHNGCATPRARALTHSSLTFAHVGGAVGAAPCMRSRMRVRVSPLPSFLSSLGRSEWQPWLLAFSCAPVGTCDEAQRRGGSG